MDFVRRVTRVILKVEYIKIRFVRAGYRRFRVLRSCRRHGRVQSATISLTKLFDLIRGKRTYCRWAKKTFGRNSEVRLKEKNTMLTHD